MGPDADACRAVNREKGSGTRLIPLRQLHGRVVIDFAEAALLEALQRASILEDAAARRVARCQAEVRATYHRAWRDLVKVLETDEEGPPVCGGDDEDQDKDEDKDQVGEAGVTAEAPAEAVNLEEPAPLSTGADAVAEPACRGGEEFLPFQPERILEQSAQLPEAVVVSIDSSAARVEGAKSASSGAERGTIEGQNPRSEPGSHRTPAICGGVAPNREKAGTDQEGGPALADQPVPGCTDMEPIPSRKHQTRHATSETDLSSLHTRRPTPHVPRSMPGTPTPWRSRTRITRKSSTPSSGPTIIWSDGRSGRHVSRTLSRIGGRRGANNERCRAGGARDWRALSCQLEEVLGGKLAGIRTET